MRGSVMSVAILVAALAAPAWAGDIECYASVRDAVLGEAMASTMLTQTGKVTSSTLSFTPEREDGEESTFFAMPAMLLDYTLKDGALVGPDKVELLFSRATRGGAALPSMQGMRVRVSGAGAGPIEGEFEALTKLEASLVRLMRENPPAKVTVELLKPSGEIEVKAIFDLSKRDKVAAMLGEAKAGAERRAAAFRELAVKGTAGTRCPQ